MKLPQNNGRVKGFAFVEFGSHKDAQAALNGLNGKELEGRAIRINFSGGKPAAGAEGGDRPPRPSGGDGASSTLFVGNISFKTNEQGL